MKRLLLALLLTLLPGLALADTAGVLLAPCPVIGNVVLQDGFSPSCPAGWDWRTGVATDWAPEPGYTLICWRITKGTVDLIWEWGASCARPVTSFQWQPGWPQRAH